MNFQKIPNFAYLGAFNASKMFEDYKAQVIALYKKKLAKGELSNNLSSPTEGKLKLECLLVFESRYQEILDWQILRDFFGLPEERHAFKPLIKKIDRERFKGLKSYLADNKKSPNNKNIELLAFLIDYQPRPYRFDEFEIDDPITTPTDGDDQADGDSGGDEDKEPQPKFWAKKEWKFGLIGISALTVLFFLFQVIKPVKSCMYWNGDRYEPIDCDRKIFERQVIALDTMMLNHFRLITKPDTMTMASIGKVWCVSIEGEYKCFTADGKYPLFPYKELKPLSLTILRKHFGSLPLIGQE